MSCFDVDVLEVGFGDDMSLPSKKKKKKKEKAAVDLDDDAEGSGISAIF